MKEVEIKVKVDDLENLKSRLSALGFVVNDPVGQEDVVYIPEDVPTVPVKAGVNVLRIRKQNGLAKLTLKQSDENNHLSKLEHETEIADPDVAEKIIACLKFKEIAESKRPA